MIGVCFKDKTLLNEFLRLEFFEVIKELFLVMNFDNFEFVKDLLEFYKMFFLKMRGLGGIYTLWLSLNKEILLNSRADARYGTKFG